MSDIEEEPMQPVDLREGAPGYGGTSTEELNRRADQGWAEFATGARSEMLPPSPMEDAVANILMRVDARIEEKIKGAVEPIEYTIWQLWSAIAELQTGELGDAYRNFIVSEARRMDVRPSEVTRK